FGTIAAMILAVAIISIIVISSKSRLGIMPRY
ncbi:MAG: PEFG-CTERM sorting domain-containing protein, partial [Candidatus Nitrosopumilus sp. MTA1]|nr:PEFG-CTERM sorting domain-containing protein [Candidatus Nitrosopumilus sp. MTA1]